MQRLQSAVPTHGGDSIESIEQEVLGEMAGVGFCAAPWFVSQSLAANFCETNARSKALGRTASKVDYSFLLLERQGEACDELADELEKAGCVSLLLSHSRSLSVFELSLSLSLSLSL